MRFYMPDWQARWESLACRLTIGSQCVICARAGRPRRNCRRPTGPTPHFPIPGSLTSNSLIRDSPIPRSPGPGGGTRPGSALLDLCSDCEALLQRRVHTDEQGYQSTLCLACGDESKLPEDDLCAACSALSSSFVRIIAPYRYEFPLDHLVKALKYREQRCLARVLGTLLAEAVLATTSDRQLLPGHLIPVPLHASSSSERGYNKSADIARWCARDLGLTLRRHWAARDYDTGSLAGLSRAERQYRILGAFRASEQVVGQRIAIVDDVLTTGSTARELAR